MVVLTLMAHLEGLELYLSCINPEKGFAVINSGNVQAIVQANSPEEVALFFPDADNIFCVDNYAIKNTSSAPIVAEKS